MTTRGKTKRPGTRRGDTSVRKRLPDDLPSAAAAALDDLLAGAGMDDDEGEELLTIPQEALGGKLKAPPRPPTERAASLSDSQLIEETVLPAVPILQVAVHENQAQLAAAQGAIVAAGHVVATGAAGQAGTDKILAAIRRGGIDAVMVALPGPGESMAAQAALIDAALALEPNRPIVIASIASSGTDAVHRATQAGADLVTTRPHDVERLAPVLLAAARLTTERRIATTAKGAEHVLRARLEELSDPEPRGLQPFELFQRTLEIEIKRARRFEYPLSVALFAVEIPPPPPPAGIRGILRARAGNALIHTIRDIDLATQLDHERFLVLLPYTDLTGAAHVGRRVIAAVAEHSPVVSAGRSFPPRVVGAVAGSRPGEELSFAKLMKDATRALEQARRDGAELAVQP
jgi:two-component system, cell cycle response regulator